MRVKRFTLHVQRFAAASGALALLLTNAPPADACTIAVLTDGERVLFANNEDWSNPDTRIWFVPAADRTGRSAAIGARDGRLRVERRADSRMLPTPAVAPRVEPASRMLAAAPSVANAAAFLRTARQEGKYPTQYSTIYDLHSGAIFVFRFASEPVRFDLSAELKRGPHFYDIPRLAEQLPQPLRPLTADMKSFQGGTP